MKEEIVFIVDTDAIRQGRIARELRTHGYVAFEVPSEAAVDIFDHCRYRYPDVVLMHLNPGDSSAIRRMRGLTNAPIIPYECIWENKGNVVMNVGFSPRASDVNLYPPSQAVGYLLDGPTTARDLTRQGVAWTI